MTFTMYIILNVMFVLLVLSLEIRGYVKQKRLLADLGSLLHSWVTKQDLNDDEFEYLVRAIKAISNPFLIVKLILWVPLVPFLQLRKNTPNSVRASLQQKHPELYAKTIDAFGDSLVYSSPTLYLILRLEIFLFSTLYKVLLMILYMLLWAVSFIFKMSKQPNDMDEKISTVTMLNDKYKTFSHVVTD